jgi:pimeloyl-ACP methyl ester carboxylesterase
MVRRAYWDTACVEEASGTSSSGATTIAWRSLGSGEPLMLINGYAATKADWDPTFLERLAERWRVICPDNRGLGESALGDEGAAAITVERYADDVLAVMDDLGIERAPLAGWSMGGFVVQTLLARNPDRVEAAILMGTHPGGPLTTNAERGVFPTLIDHSGTPEEQAHRLIGLLFPEPAASAIERDFGDVVAAARAALDHDALCAQEQLMVDWHAGDATERLARIAGSGIPVLCAHGAADVVVPAANSDTLAAQLPGSWKAIFPGAGHAVMAMEPDRLTAVIAAFLGRA